MNGDGLPDWVRIRNGKVAECPSLGCGRFGPKVTMNATPWLTSVEQFDASQIRLADVDGSGPSRTSCTGTGPGPGFGQTSRNQSGAGGAGAGRSSDVRAAR